MIFTPHDYQRRAIAEVMVKPSCGLLLDMGLGKTVITLTAISNLIAMEEVSKVLVIAPLQTARNTWQDEVSKWEHLSGLRLSHILGTAEQRKTAADVDADVYIINRENVVWLCEYMQGKPWKWDMLVIDELSSFKNPSAKRFKALRKVRPFFKRVVGLTGTPAPNGYEDLWSEMYLLDRGERLFQSVTKYRQVFFYPARSNGHIVYSWALKDGAKAVIDKRLEDICISMKSEDYLSMPDRVESNIYISMTAQERKIYDTFARQHILPEWNVEGLQAAAVQNKLLQMANGFCYDDQGEVHRIHEQKLEALDEIIEAAQRPILLFYSFVADKDIILDHLKQSFKGEAICTLKTREDVKAWNEGKYKVMLCHPASAGHGLNLQQGGNTVVWYGLPWSLELYKQANARLYRQGQKHTVYVYHLLTKGTHDDDVLKALQNKDTTQEALMSALKARIESWRQKT